MEMRLQVFFTRAKCTVLLLGASLSFLIWTSYQTDPTQLNASTQSISTQVGRLVTPLLRESPHRSTQQHALQTPQHLQSESKRWGDVERSTIQLRDGTNNANSLTLLAYFSLGVSLVGAFAKVLRHRGTQSPPWGMVGYGAHATMAGTSLHAVGDENDTEAPKPAPKRRGRPPGSKNKPKAKPAPDADAEAKPRGRAKKAAAEEETGEAEAVAKPKPRRGRPPGKAKAKAKAKALEAEEAVAKPKPETLVDDALGELDEPGLSENALDEDEDELVDLDDLGESVEDDVVDDFLALPTPKPRPKYERKPKAKAPRWDDEDDDVPWEAMMAGEDLPSRPTQRGKRFKFDEALNSNPYAKVASLLIQFLWFTVVLVSRKNSC